MQHAARAAHAVVQLQVAVAIPGQRGHTFGELQVLTLDRIGNLARSLGTIGPSVAMNITFHTT